MGKLMTGAPVIFLLIVFGFANEIFGYLNYFIAIGIRILGITAVVWLLVSVIRKLNESDLAAPTAEEISGTSSDLDQDLSYLSPFQRKHYRLQQNFALSEKDNGDLDLKSSD